MAQRVATETALRESEGRFSAFFNSVRAGILVIDAESFQIVEANPAAEAMIGLPVEQIRGRNCREFLPVRNTDAQSNARPMRCFRPNACSQRRRGSELRF